MTAKIAKEWFRANPRSVVTWHRRWELVPAASRERMEAPRTATVRSNGINFGSSVLSLMNARAEVSSDGQLTISYFDVPTVAYLAAPL